MASMIYFSAAGVEAAAFQQPFSSRGPFSCCINKKGLKNYFKDTYSYKKVKIISWKKISKNSVVFAVKCKHVTTDTKNVVKTFATGFIY